MFHQVYTLHKKEKQSKCPLTDEWARKCVVYIKDGIVFSPEKEGNSDSCCNRVDIEEVVK